MSYKIHEKSYVNTKYQPNGFFEPFGWYFSAFFIEKMLISELRPDFLPTWNCISCMWVVFSF